MARIGDFLRPELGRTDYRGYNFGAREGGAAIGQGISNLGAGVGKAIKSYREKKEKKAQSEALESVIGRYGKQMGLDEKDVKGLSSEIVKSFDGDPGMAMQGVLAFVEGEQRKRLAKQVKQQRENLNATYRSISRMDDKALNPVQRFIKQAYLRGDNPEDIQAKASEVAKQLAVDNNQTPSPTTDQLNFAAAQGNPAFARFLSERGGGIYMALDSDGNPVYAQGPAAKELAGQIRSKGRVEARLIGANRLFNTYFDTLENFRDRAIGPYASTNVAVKQVGGSLGLLDVSEEDLKDIDFRTALDGLYNTMIGMAREMAGDEKLSDQDVKRYRRLPSDPKAFFAEPRYVKQRMATLLELISKGNAEDMKALYGLDIIGSKQDLMEAHEAGYLNNRLAQYYAEEFHGAGK